MADEVKAKVEELAANAPDPTKDLKILIKGTDGKASIKDKEGKKHDLPPLDLADLIEAEDKKGINFLNLGGTDLGLKHACYLLYLSLRKEGLSKDQIAKRNWTRTERDVYMMFDLEFLKNSMDIFMELLTISGLEVSRPPAAATQTAADDASEKKT